MNREWRLANEEMWTGRTAVLLGSGPSLEGFDFARLADLDCAILAIKEAYRLVPRYDVVFSADMNWLRRDGVVTALAPALETCRVWFAVPEVFEGADKVPNLPGIRFLRRSRDERMAEDPAWCTFGMSSGFGALNFAYHRRPARIFMLGMDYGHPGGAHHVAGLNPWYQPHNTGHFPAWAAAFKNAVPQLAGAGIECVNFSPASVIDAFPRADRDSIFERLDRL